MNGVAPYFWLLALPVVIGLGRRAGTPWERWVLLLAWIGLSLFIGLRREVGSDLENYLLMYVRAGNLALAEAVQLSDPGYMLVSGIFSRLGFGLPAVNLACATVFTGGLLLLVRRQPAPGLAFVSALPVLLAIVVFATRQSVAIGGLMAALALHASGRPRWAAFLILLTPVFHWTAILLLPFVPVMLGWKPRLRLVIAAGAAAGLALAALVALTPLGERFAHLEESSGAVLRGSLTAITLVVFALRWRKLGLSAAELRMVAILAAIGLFTLALIPVLSTAADRLGYYAIPLQMIVLPRAVHSIVSPARRRAALAAITIIFMGMFVAWMLLSPYRACLTPYRSYLSSPGTIRNLDPQAHRRFDKCVIHRNLFFTGDRSTLLRRLIS